LAQVLGKFEIIKGWRSWESTKSIVLIIVLDILQQSVVTQDKVSARKTAGADEESSLNIIMYKFILV